MWKAVITGERQAELREVADPRPRDDWAVVKVWTAPMCTEYKGWLAGWQGEHLGHEAVGEVVGVAQPCRVKPGDRVVVMPQYPCGACELCVAGDYIHCEHLVDATAFTGCPEGTATQAQYLVKPSWLLPVIPEDLSYDDAGLSLCALGPSFAAFEAMRVDAFDTVLITGAGPVGLGGVVNARYSGARVLVVEGVPYRQQLARELGAEEVLDTTDEATPARIRELTGGRGVDKALDCSGVPAAHRLCIDAARRRGHVAFVGECDKDTVLHVSPDLIRKGLTIHGAWHYNLSLYPRIVEVIRHSPVARKLVTHTFPLREIQRALEVSASRQCGKILLHPWE